MQLCIKRMVLGFFLCALSGLHAETITYSLQQLGWNSSVSLNGYKPSYTLFLPIPRNWQLSQALLHLNMSFSPDLAAQSRLVIKFNDYPLRQLTLPSTTPLTADIALPLLQFGDSWQKITFSAYLESAKNLCDPDIWMYFLPNTTLSIDFTRLPFDGSLNQLPYPFIDPTNINPIPTLIVLPNAPSSQDLNALFQVALRLGRTLENSQSLISTGFMGHLEKSQLENSHLIALGLTQQLFQDPLIDYKNILNSPEINQALSNQLGVLSLTPSPLNPQFGLLIITGIDQSAFNKALNAFTLPEFKSLSFGKHAFIKNVNFEPKVSQFRGWNHTTYKGLGYENRSVSGLGRHGLSYLVPLPYNQSPTQTTFKTFITAPLSLANGSSQITLVVNGAKQSSFQLKKEHSEWITSMELDALKPGMNQINYVFDLHLPDENCERQDFDQVWATIHAQSEIETVFSNHFPKTMLNQLPVPFGSEINIIFPDNLANTDIALLTRLFLKLGQLFSDDAQQIALYHSHEVDETFIRNHNIILIGTPSNNPWINFLFDFLPIKIKGAERIFNSQQNRLQLTDTRSIGLLELAQSPWGGAHAILLITGDKAESLAWAIQSLTDDKKRLQLNGNIALINANKNIEVVNSYSPRYMSFTEKMLLIINVMRYNMVYYAQNYGQFIVYFIGIIVPIFIFLRRRKIFSRRKK